MCYVTEQIHFVLLMQTSKINLCVYARGCVRRVCVCVCVGACVCMRMYLLVCLLMCVGACMCPCAYEYLPIDVLSW